jgi:hypothetical protein
MPAYNLHHEKEQVEREHVDPRSCRPGFGPHSLVPELALDFEWYQSHTAASESTSRAIARSDFRVNVEERFQAGLQLLLNISLATFQGVHGDMGLAPSQFQRCITDLVNSSAAAGAARTPESDL